MPQLPSGRHIGLSEERLFSALEDASVTVILAFMVSENRMDEIYSAIDILYYEGNADPVELGAQPPGKLYRSGWVVSDVNSDACDWSEEDKFSFKAWLKQPYVQDWMNDISKRISAKLTTAKVPEALRGLFD
jgi:hypothetical protein